MSTTESGTGGVTGAAYGAVFQAVPESLILVDAASGRFVDLNRAARAMFGYEDCDLSGADLGLISSGVHPHSLEVALEENAAVRAGETRTVSWQCRKKSGNLFWAEAAITKAEIAGRACRLWLLRDITERRKTDDKLSRTLSKLAAANEAKSGFLAAMSHELRTPLNAVIGFSDLMRTEAMGPLGNERYRDYVDAIHKSGRHLLALINDVLDLARLDAGKLQLSESLVDLDRMVEDCRAAIAPQARLSKLIIEPALPVRLPPLQADERRIRQVALNLLSNAVKFTPPGGKVTITAGDTPAGLWIKIADTGIGIDNADLPKVMQRFGQVDSAFSRRYEGAGLGLPLAKQLMELHGGTLTLESEPGAGTTAILSFPPERVIRPVGQAVA